MADPKNIQKAFGDGTNHDFPYIHSGSIPFIRDPYGTSMSMSKASINRLHDSVLKEVILDEHAYIANYITTTSFSFDAEQDSDELDTADYVVPSAYSRLHYDPEIKDHVQQPSAWKQTLNKIRGRPPP